MTTPTLRLILEWKEQAVELERLAGAARDIERDRLSASATVLHRCVQDYWSAVMSELLELSTLISTEAAEEAESPQNREETVSTD